MLCNLSIMGLEEEKWSFHSLNDTTASKIVMKGYQSDARKKELAVDTNV